MLPRSASASETSVDGRAIREALRGGRLVDDRRFDELYPRAIGRASATYWTPVEAAVRAAILLAHGRRARILDVGAGVGKFCIVAAAATGARVAGIEHRPHFVEIGRTAAARVGVDVELKAGSLDDCDPAAFDGLYLFNPFAENLCTEGDWLDETVELSRARFVRDVDAAEAFMRAARVGTRVVTYCGFGGVVPPSYVRILREYRAGTMELWAKVAGAATEEPPASETRRGGPQRA